MRHADSKHFLKTALLLTTAILVIGNTAAIGFNSPPNPTADGFEVNVTDFSTDAVNFTLEGSKTIEDREGDVSGDYATTIFSVGDTDSGDYTLTAEAVDNGSVEDSEEKEILVDVTKPSIEMVSQDEYVQSDPQLEFTVSDDYTAVTSVSYESFSTSVDDDSRSDVCGAGGECSITFDVDSEDVSTGNTFAVDLEAEDIVGNQRTEEFQYTIDDSFEADTPEFSVDGNEDGVVELDGDVNVDVTVENIDEETSDEIRVKCLVDGDEIDTSDWDDSEDFSCSIPEEDVEDETVNVGVEACDQAGNCAESDEREITFDASDPVLESFGAVQEYKVFSEDFEVEYEASDSATDIESLEYFFSSAVVPGEGNQVEPSDQKFKVETSLLSKDENQHTVYMRVRDEAGRWSDYKSLDFEYYPDASPSLSLSVPENFSVKAGNTKGFDVVLDNTGKLMIDEVNVSFSSDLMEDEKKAENLEGGESMNVEFAVEPTREQIGEWSVEASTNGPIDTASTTVLVEANSNQRSSVDRKLENYSALLESLESNISDLKEGGLNDELDESLKSGVSSFKDTVKAAESHVEEKDYYEAYSVLEDVDSQYYKAERTFSQVREKDRIQERNRILMMVLGGFLILVVGSGVFVYSRDGMEFDPADYGLDEYRLPETGAAGETVSGAFDEVKEKILELTDKLEQEEEEVEQKFQGFN